MAPARRCPSCEADVQADARFCHRCGAVLDRSDTLLAATEAPRPVPAPLPPMRLPEGTMLGPYRIEGVLGEGGMGVVYRAEDTAAKRAVALKCLHTNLVGDPEVRRRFAREARVLRVWSHPGAVAVHDFVEHQHILAIVMEIVEGQNLAGHLAKWRGRIPLGEVRSIMADVLEAMDDAHRHGVIHRDLKPDNILLRADGGVLRPKIADFGIAKVLEGTTYTVSGALLGTCRYMSPEQVKTPSLADHRSDIYSLGVTLYELVTGVPPFDGSHFSVMMAHVGEKPRPPSLIRPEIPPALEDLILDALAKDPAERPGTCGGFRERLLAAIDEDERISVSMRASWASLPATLHETNGHQMILVAPGPFQMGQGRREVHLDAFYIDRTPVTNEQFKVFLDATGYTPEDDAEGRFLQTWRKGRFPRGQDKHPVTFVSWFDARAYAAWAGRRLPTEAEWEKAARGTDGRKYPWGRTEPSVAHASFARPHDGTSPVGSFPEGASPYGALDMAGNVWEWCDDVDDAAFYENGPPFNPKSTARLGDKRARYVMRGGSFMYDARALRTFARIGYDPHYRVAEVGFRCAKSAG